MHIGIDGLLIRSRNAGSSRYFHQLLSAIANQQDMTGINLFSVHINPGYADETILPVSDYLRYITTNWGSFLPGAIRQQSYYALHQRLDYDILHTPFFVPPLVYPGKTVMTLHDLTFWFYPETQKFTGRLWWKLFAKPGFDWADLIVTISESTKRDVCKIFHVPESKVRVVHPYVSGAFRPVPDTHRVIKKYQLPEKYILFVGTLEPRKNLPFLIRVFDFARKRANFDHSLVLVGSKGWYYQEIYQTIRTLQLDKQVILLGYVPDEDMPGLYSTATVLAFLSRYEGFGYPALEAMACGVPVLASNVSSIPEIVGDAAILVDPDDLDSAASSLIRLIKEENLRRSLITAGLEQATKFNRPNFTTKMLNAYTEVFEARGK